MGATLPNIKQGDTFRYQAVWNGAVASELKSQIRNNSGVLIAEVLVEETQTPFTFQLTVHDTTNWPIGSLLTDIQRTSGGIIQSSETMSFKVEKDVTRDE